MNTIRKLAVVAATACAAAAFSGAALADRGGHGWHGGYHRGGGHVGAIIGGAIIGGALLSPWYYPYYYPRYPATVVEVVPSPAPVYIEQYQPAPPAVASAAPADAGNWWYYCADTKTYYPYVKECASPWQKVAPTPPATR